MPFTKIYIHRNQSWGKQLPWSWPWLRQTQVFWYPESNVWLGIWYQSTHVHVTWALQGCDYDSFVFSCSVQSWTAYVHQSNVWQQGSFRPHSPCYLHYLVPKNCPTGHNMLSFHLLYSGLSWHKFISKDLSWSQRSTSWLSSCLSWRLWSSDHLQEFVRAQLSHLRLTRC